MAENEYKGIWIFAEQRGGEIERTVLELLNKAKELQTVNGEPITAVLLGDGVAPLAQTLFEYGADEVLLAESPALRVYSARPYERALTELAQKYRPSIILYGATPLGVDLAPRMMVSLNTGLTADAIDVGYDADGVFCQTTPAYGGKILAHIAIRNARPQMATVHPHICESAPRVEGARGKLTTERLAIEPDPDFEILETTEADTCEKTLNKAAVIIAGGRGIKKQEDLSLLEQLAAELNGQPASSRPLVDNGWMPHSRQIGQSGATVAPDFILNFAISGSVQYQLGMQKAKCIVAVNQDREAPIFDIAHYGAVADYRELLPALIDEIRSRKLRH